MFYVTRPRNVEREKKNFVLSSSLRTPDPSLLLGTLDFLSTCLGIDFLMIFIISNTSFCLLQRTSLAVQWLRLCFHCKGHGFNPWSGNKISQTSQVALVAKNPHANAGDVKRCKFDLWVGKILWRKAWQPTPIFLPGESHGQGNLVGCRVQWVAESDMTEGLSSSHS